MVLVDSNVLIDVLKDDEAWADRSIRQLRRISRLHDLVINPVIYAELSLAFEAVEDLDAAVAEMRVRVVDIPKAALFLAGKAFVRYRRRGGTKHGVLPDFFIGAHAP